MSRFVLVGSRAVASSVMHGWKSAALSKLCDYFESAIEVHSRSAKLKQTILVPG